MNKNAKIKKTLRCVFAIIKKIAPDNQGEHYFTESEIISFFDKLQSFSPQEEQKPNRYYYSPEDRDEEPYIMLLQGDNKSDIPKSNDFIHGVFLKIRNKNYPVEYSLRGIMSELELNPDSYLAEVVYFTIHKKTGIVVYNNNRFVGGEKRLTSYFNYFYNTLSEDTGYCLYTPDQKKVQAFTLDLIPRLNPEKQIDEVTNLRRIEIRLAMTQNGLSSLNLSTKKETVLCKELNDHPMSDNLTIVFSQKQQSDSISLKSAKAFIASILPFVKSSDKGQCLLKGKIDEESRIIDLISDKYVHIEEVEFEKGYIPPEELFPIFENVIKRYENKISTALARHSYEEN